MLSAIKRLFSPKVDGQALALAEARAKRNAAIAAYKQAKDAGDTRLMHEAQRSVRHATTDLVRIEVGG
jgi:hypothetical protein